MPSTKTTTHSIEDGDLSAAQVVTPRRLLPARVAALTAAIFLLGNAALWMAAAEDMGDHATVAGRASEALVGASFVAGALALLLIARAVRGSLGRWRIVWWLAVFAMLAAGLTMIAVFVSTTEPPFQLFLAEAGLAAASLIAVGISGWRARGRWPSGCSSVWPRWRSWPRCRRRGMRAGRRPACLLAAHPVPSDVYVAVGLVLATILAGTWLVAATILNRLPGAHPLWRQ